MKLIKQTLSPVAIVIIAIAGDMYVNVGTGHVLSPELCIVGPCSGRIGLLPSSIVGGSTDLFRWTTTVL